MKAWLWLSASVLVLILGLQAESLNLSHAASVDCLEGSPDALFETTQGELSSIKDAEGRKLWRWKIETGKSSRLSLRPGHPLYSSLRYFDLVDLEFRIASGAIHELEMRALGQVSGVRQAKVHQWTCAIATTPKEVWHKRQLRLITPNWLPWAKRDGHGRDAYWYFEAAALLPDTVIEFREVSLHRERLSLKPDHEWPVTWPMKLEHQDGSWEYRLDLHLMNASGQTALLKAEVASVHEHFDLEVLKSEKEVRSEKKAKWTLIAKPKEALSGLEPSYGEDLEVVFSCADDADLKAVWRGRLLKPIADKVERFVLLPKADRAEIRSHFAVASPEERSGLGFDAVIKAADEFLAKSFEMIPHSENHVKNRYPSVKLEGKYHKMLPGRFCPEAVSANGEVREVGTPLANQVWLEYLNGTGKALESLGMAYTLTGDEKYAKKGIAVLGTFAQQYRHLKWNTSLFDAPWNRGHAFLSAAKFAASSTYGDNWYMKGLCRMASHLADSPSWSEEVRAKVVEGFVVPYASNLKKFVGGISNMTDVTNHNLLLLGLAFRDAHMVDHALFSDPGIARRILDIDKDGFSSEGRSINYHRAGLIEVVPCLAFLKWAAWPMDIDWQRLLKAVEMPFARANVASIVPNSGDSGRYQVLRKPGMLEEYVYALFPEEKWLLAQERPSAFPLKVQKALGRFQAAPKLWEEKVSHESIHYEKAGFAVLRSGSNVQDQVMVTLDYGKNMFHAHPDRQQITLSAFGKIFSHGTGSLYNAGRGGIVRVNDEALESFIKSVTLSHNLVVVDEQNQQPAVGVALKSQLGGELQCVVSRIEGIAEGVRYDRAVVLTRGVIVLVDVLASSKEHTYDSVYHNFGAFAEPSDWVGAPVESALAQTGNYDQLIGLKRWTPKGDRDRFVCSWDLSDQVSGKKKSTEEPVHLAFRAKVDGTDEVYTATTGMNNPNTKRIPDAAPSILIRKKAAKAHFVTVLEPHRGRSKCTAWRLEGGVLCLSFELSPSELESGVSPKVEIGLKKDLGLSF